jgi:hypothetical protein
MNDPDNFALVPGPPGAVERAETGKKRIITGIVSDTLALAQEKAEVQRVSAEQANTEQLENWYTIGYIYYHGYGVPQDYAEAVYWFRMAAEQGDPSAQVYLGHCYKFGLGVPADDAEAVKWFRKAAEQEHDDGQFELGCCYSEGFGVPEDGKESLKWIGLAALQGHSGALYYFEGVADSFKKEGYRVPMDLGEAVWWVMARLDHL